MSSYIQVTFTTESEADAKRLARSVVEARLAACAQVSGPISSFYWWDGALQEATEWQCRAKTTADCYDRLERHILERHPYDTPEIIAALIVRGSADYLAWLQAETQTGARTE
jgi:periplasmic divalent cation tolerance protein